MIKQSLFPFIIVAAIILGSLHAVHGKTIESFANFFLATLFIGLFFWKKKS